MMTHVERFWKWPRVTRLFKTGWTCIMISRRSETDHYRCPSAFLSLGRGQEHSLRSYGFPGTPRNIEGSRLIEVNSGSIAVALVLVF